MTAVKLTAGSFLVNDKNTIEEFYAIYDQTYGGIYYATPDTDGSSKLPIYSNGTYCIGFDNLNGAHLFATSQKAAAMSNGCANGVNIDGTSGAIAGLQDHFTFSTTNAKALSPTQVLMTGLDNDENDQNFGSFVTGTLSTAMSTSGYTGRSSSPIPGKGRRRGTYTVVEDIEYQEEEYGTIKKKTNGVTLTVVTNPILFYNKYYYSAFCDDGNPATNRHLGLTYEGDNKLYWDYTGFIGDSSSKLKNRLVAGHGILVSDGAFPSASLCSIKVGAKNSNEDSGRREFYWTDVNPAEVESGTYITRYYVASVTIS